MDNALFSALPVVLGSIVGATSTIATTWISHRNQTKREVLRRELRKREGLYGEFISECSRLAIDSLAHGMEQPETMWAAYALLNRIRLSASEAVLREAENVLTQIARQYASPNLSIDEFRSLASSLEIDPLKGFGHACRSELNSIAKGE